MYQRNVLRIVCINNKIQTQPVPGRNFKGDKRGVDSAGQYCSSLSVCRYTLCVTHAAEYAARPMRVASAATILATMKQKPVVSHT